MFEMKKCNCGATTFKLLVDVNIHVACTNCGTFFKDVDELQGKHVNINFKLEHA